MEKRNYKRINLNVEIKYEIIEDSLAKAFYSGTRNLSSEGVCFISFKKLEVGSTLRIEFTLPKLNRVVITKGKVVWVKLLQMKTAAAKNIYEIGVHLKGLSDQDKIAINEYSMAKS